MYILVKGINGFGNLMSVLSFYYKLAKLTNNTLVVDWNHAEWQFGIDNYFSFNRNLVKYMPYEKFKEEIKKKKELIYHYL